MKRIIVVAVSCCLLTTGCYVATVDMKKPTGKVNTQSFAPSWIFGLVPPPTVDAAAMCPEGVSIVETQHSFLNYLVGGITFGIYTPIQIKVTCAAGGTARVVDPENEVRIPTGATHEMIADAYSRAAKRAVESREPVYVHFDH